MGFLQLALTLLLLAPLLFSPEPAAADRRYAFCAALYPPGVVSIEDGGDKFPQQMIVIRSVHGGLVPVLHVLECVKRFAACYGAGEPEIRKNGGTTATVVCLPEKRGRAGFDGAD